MIAAIFAMDEMGGMGREGTLPWPHDKEDMKWFQSHTKGHVVVMGRKSWDDPKMPKPLPNRTSVVVTSQTDNYKWADHVVSGIDSILELEKLYPEKIIWIAGGPTLLMAMRPHITRAVVTYFHGNYNCDAKLDVKGFLNGLDSLQNETFGRNKTFLVLDGQLSRAA